MKTTPSLCRTSPARLKSAVIANLRFLLLALFVLVQCATSAFAATVVSVSSNEPTLFEGDSVNLTFTRTVSDPADLNTVLVINLAISGTARNTSPALTADYDDGAGAAIPTTVTFPDGASSVNVVFHTIADNIIEAASGETAIFDIIAGTGYTVSPLQPQVVETIVDNGTLPIVSITQTENLVDENNATPVVFTVRRTGPTAGDLFVPLIISGTATNGVDYSSIPSNVTIPDGSSEVDINISPIDDTLQEGSANETVRVGIGASANYTISTASPRAILEIRDNDTPPEVSITSTVRIVDEGNPGPIKFTVHRTGSTTNPLVVSLVPSGTAINGVDYNSIPNSVVIAKDQTEATIDIVPIDDTLQEGSINEFLTVSIGASGTYTISPGAPSATLEISDNDTAPVVSITQTQNLIDEDDAGPVVFTVRRTGSSTNDLVVPLVITGTAINGVDYESIPNSVTIAAGEFTHEISIIPIDDNIQEGDVNEFLNVAIGASSAYGISTDSPGARLEIRDNDVPPVVSILRGGADRVEGSTFTRQAGILVPDLDTFLAYFVRRTGSTQNSLRVYISTSGTATQGADYLPLNSFVTIPAKQESLVFYVQTFQDTEVEGAESVKVTLDPPSGTPTPYTIASGAPSATVNILDDDTGPVVTISATDAVGAEPSNGLVFTVRRTYPTTGASLSLPVTVNYELSGSAVNGTDYQTLSGTVTIPSGSATATINVTPIDDTLVETDETVTATLVAPAGPFYSVGTADIATGTIQDNDTPISVSVIASVSGRPENFLAVDTTSGVQFIATGSGEFTFIRTNPNVSGLTVNYTVSGTATPGTDYTSLPGSVSFAPGQSRVTVPVDYIGDFIYEGNETVDVQVASGDGYIIGSPAAAEVVISDDETPPIVSLTASTTNATEEGKIGQFAVLREVTDSRQLVGDLEVQYAVSGTATNGVDYITLTGTATIRSGSDTGFIDVKPFADSVFEPDETVIVTLLTSNTASYKLATVTTATTTTGARDITATVIIEGQSSPASTVVSATASDDYATDRGANTGQITFTRTGTTRSSLTVRYKMTGSAKNGKDYGRLSGVVTIPAGSSTATVTIRPQRATGTVVKATFTPTSTPSYRANRSGATVTIRHFNKIGF